MTVLTPVAAADTGSTAYWRPPPRQSSSTAGGSPRAFGSAASNTPRLQQGGSRLGQENISPVFELHHSPAAAASSGGFSPRYSDAIEASIHNKENIPPGSLLNCPPPSNSWGGGGSAAVALSPAKIERARLNAKARWIAEKPKVLAELKLNRPQSPRSPPRGIDEAASTDAGQPEPTVSPNRRRRINSGLAYAQLRRAGEAEARVTDLERELARRTEDVPQLDINEGTPADGWFSPRLKHLRAELGSSPPPSPTASPLFCCSPTAALASMTVTSPTASAYSPGSAGWAAGRSEQELLASIAAAKRDCVSAQRAEAEHGVLLRTASSSPRTPTTTPQRPLRSDHFDIVAVEEAPAPAPRPVRTEAPPRVRLARTTRVVTPDRPSAVSAGSKAAEAAEAAETASAELMEQLAAARAAVGGMGRSEAALDEGFAIFNEAALLAAADAGKPPLPISASTGPMRPLQPGWR